MGRGRGDIGAIMVLVLGGKGCEKAGYTLIDGSLWRDKCIWKLFVYIGGSYVLCGAFYGWLVGVLDLYIPSLRWSFALLELELDLKVNGEAMLVFARLVYIDDLGSCGME